jgi:hypothetical protein
MDRGMLAGLVSLVLAFGPPELPPDDGPRIEEPPDTTEPEAPADPPTDPPADAPSETPPSDTVEPPSEAPVEDEAIPVTPTEPPADTPTEPPTEGPVEPTPVEPTIQQPTQPGPTVQRPGGTTPKPVVPPPEAKPAPVEPESEPESKPAEEETDAKKDDDKPKKKLGGFRLARLGVFAKLGYTNGVSQKNGIFDRNKSLQDSINNQDPTLSGAGDLGTTRFGGFQGGFGIDAEVVGINAWFDFHKFFRPGGMWSVLLGYDHEFGFGERYRLDVGAGVGVQKVFLGKALENLYYDKSNPTAVNIGTLGIEARAMADFHIKIVGPLFTGPYAMIGYHYLWSANAAEVTAEKGMHFSLGWTLRIDLATPKLLGRGRK